MPEAPTASQPPSDRIGLPERPSLMRDVLAALTVTTLAVPQAMAYAQIAELPPIYGLYATILPTIVAALFCRSRLLVTGTTNSFCMLTFAIIAPLAAVGSTRFLSLVLLLALLVGIIQLVMGLSRVGVIFRYVSYAVVVGFNAAMGFLIGINQIKNVLRVDVDAVHPAPRLWHSLRQIGDAHLPTVLLAFGTAAVILLLGKFAPRFPGYLIAILGATIVVWALDLKARGVVTVKELSGDLTEMFSLPVQFGNLMGLGQDAYALLSGALTLAAVGALESVTIASVTARETGEQVDPNRELISRGAGNVTASFVSGMPVSGSFSRTALNLRAGATSRWSAVFQGVFTGLALVLAAGAAWHIPIAALSGMLLVVCVTMVNVGELRRVARATRADAATIALTGATVVLVDIRYGLLLGILVSVGWHLYQVSRPEITHMYADGSGHFHQVPVEADADAKRYPVILIMQVAGEMFFGTSEELTRAFDKILDHPTPPRVVVLRLKRARHLDATTTAVLAGFEKRFAEREGKLMLCGLTPEIKETLDRSGLTAQIGEKFILATRDDIFGSTVTAMNRARDWVEDNPPPGDDSEPYVPFYQI